MASKPADFFVTSDEMRATDSVASAVSVAPPSFLASCAIAPKLSMLPASGPANCAALAASLPPYCPRSLMSIAPALP